MAQPSLFDEMGGEVALSMVVDRFIDRVFSDSMIGFFFAHADRERIKNKEYELAAATLGAPIEYSGRELGPAHARHAIQTGHFFRRLEILRQTLHEFQVPERVARHWLDHNAALQAVVVTGSDLACGPGGAESPPGDQASIREKN